MKKIYFICTGNSCRSQMAEGFAKKELARSFEVRSAGVEKHGLNPQAVQVMKEIGYDISGQTSDLIDLEYFNQCDLIVTLCGDARDKCPVVPKGHEHHHWALDDPAGKPIEKFRQVRDEIEKRVKKLK